MRFELYICTSICYWIQLYAFVMHTACAMWFAARGKGRMIVYNQQTLEYAQTIDQEYSTPAHILLVGIGMTIINVFKSKLLQYTYIYLCIRGIFLYITK